MTRNPLPGEHSFTSQKIIEAPAEAVWQVLADFSVADTWAPQVTRSYSLTEHDRGLGAGRHCDIKGFGSIQETITDWQEGRSLTYDVTPLGPIAVAWSRWSVRSIDADSCQLIIDFSYNTRFGLFGKLMSALVMKRKLNKAIPQGLDAMKYRVETGKLIRPRRSLPDEPQLLSSAL